jgi:hypothetical protein
MALGERFNEGVRAEVIPMTVGLPSVDQSTQQENQPTIIHPITKKDILLAAGALSKRNLLRANGLPVVPGDLLNRVDDEVYNPSDWKNGRVVGVREDVVALRVDAMFNIARALLSQQRLELPEGLRGPAVQDLLAHLIDHMRDGNLDNLAVLIGNPKKRNY